MHDYLTKPHILGYDMSRSRSPLRVKGHNFWSHRDRQLMFSVQVYLMKPHVLSGNIIRSRSFFKVNGQIWSVGHNFGSSRDRDFIFMMPVYFFKAAYFEHVKVKVIPQGQGSNEHNFWIITERDSLFKHGCASHESTYLYRWHVKVNVTLQCQIHTLNTAFILGMWEGGIGSV